MRKIILCFLLFPLLSNAQYFTYNFGHDMGNNGPGQIVINGTCNTAQNHYIAVGKIAGTVDADLDTNVHFVNGNQYPVTSKFNAFFGEYDSSLTLIRAFAISPLTSRTTFEAVTTDAGGNIYIAGLMGDSAYLEPNNPMSVSYSNNGNNQMFLAKYNASLDLIWLKTFGNNSALNPRRLKTDHQNNIILAGEFENTFDADPSASTHMLASYNGGNLYTDAFLTKFDGNGNLLWAKNLGSTVDDFLADITIDGSNNVYIGVSYNGNTAFVDSSVIVNALGTYFICISKFSSAGQWEWNKAISNSGGGIDLHLNDLEANNNGEVFFTGWLSGNAYFQAPNFHLTSGSGSGCDFLAKLKPNGDCYWAYGSNSTTSRAWSLALDAQCNIYLGGTFLGTKDFDYKTGVSNLYSNPSTSYNYSFASYDSSGSYRWAYRINTTGTPEVQVNNAGKVLISGDFNSNADFDPGTGTNTIYNTNASEFITSYTSNGTYQGAWAFHGSGTTKERVSAIKAKTDGTIIVAGLFSGNVDLDHSNNNLIFKSSLDSNAYIASYSSSGALNWATQLKGRALIKGIAIDGTGNIFVTGAYIGACYFDATHQPLTYTSAASGALDIFLVKYDSLGVMQWVQKYGSALNDEGHDISVDQHGNVVMGGVFTTSVDFDYSTSGSFLLTTPQNITSCYVAKYDNSGNFIHAFKIVAANLHSLATDNNNNILVSGVMITFGNFNAAGPGVIVYSVGGSGDEDYYLAKYDSSGNYIWAFGLGDISSNRTETDLALDDAGSIFFTAYPGNYPDSLDIDPGAASVLLPANKGLLLKYAASGNLEWGINTAVRRYCSIAVDQNGNSTLAAELLPNADLDPGPGTIVLSPTLPSCLLARYSSVGEYLGAVSYSTNNAAYSVIPEGLVITPGNKVITGGYFNGDIDFDAAPGTQDWFLNSGSTVNVNGFLLSFQQPAYLAQVPPTAAFSAGSTNFCTGSCINFQDVSLYAPSSWSWSFPGAVPSASNSQHPQNICYPNAGVFDVRLIVSNPLGTDTLLMPAFIHVDNIPATNAGADISICDGGSLQLNGSGALTYSWSPATYLSNTNTYNPVATPAMTTTYTLTGTNGSCSATDDITIVVNPNPATPVISPSGIEIQSTPAFAYQWYYNGMLIPGATFQTLFPTQAGNYTVTVFDATGCYASSSSYLVTVVGINSTSVESGLIVITPNPGKGIFNVKSNTLPESIDVYNMIGERIQSLVKTNFIDLSAYPDGMYMANINHVQCIRLVKQ